MKNEYRIKLSYTLNGDAQNQWANAIYGDDLLLDTNIESGEQYYRTRLNGKLIFVNADYDFIMAAAFDSRIDCNIEINEHNVWNFYFAGYFYRTDCDINEDDKIITVQLSNNDKYTDVLGAIDTEVDLVKIAPIIHPIIIEKRPCLQLYAAGSESITCVLGNMSWEQDCDSESDDTILRDTFHFAFWGNYVSAALEGVSSSVPSFFAKKLATNETLSSFSITNGQYTLTVSEYTAPDGVTIRVLVAIDRNGTRQWDTNLLKSEWGMPMNLTLTGRNGNPSCQIALSNAAVYGRIICDVDSILGVTTFAIAANDLVGNNRNYRKVSPVPSRGDLVLLTSGALSTTPTEWGIYDSGKYYTTPFVVGGGEFLPVLRNSWGRVSIWIMQSTALDYVDQTARAATILKDAYRLRNAIDAILDATSTGLTLRSDFLAGQVPITPISGEHDEGLLYITPKSNILNINYTEPAQSAKITLRQILNALRDIYRCYWMIDGGYLRIEHIEWFRRGGRYTGAPSVGVDLTQNATVRNGKLWSFLTSKYKYEKLDMPCRYEFGWMDDATIPFSGWPIDMLSNYVDKSRVDKIRVANFDTDIDYLMLNPANVSKDGFVLLKGDLVNMVAAPIEIEGTGKHTLISYKIDAPESVSVIYDCAGYGTIYAWNGNQLIMIDEWNPGDAGQGISFEWDLPAGTKSIVVELSGSEPSFTLQSFEPSILQVKYWNWNYNGITNHWLQNGVLSFAYTQRYYAYDMPCKDYRIGSGVNAETKIALGTSKHKVQDVSFPTPGYYDDNRIVRTNLGDGKVRKISINLSSKMAQATLEYDTE